MENENKKICKNCKYFSQHYIKYGKEFIPIECGACMCEKMKGEQRRQFSIYDGCKFFKDKQI